MNSKLYLVHTPYESWRVLIHFYEFFHHVIIMRYPSKEKFIEFSSSEKWRAIEHHRTEGLESQWLLATKENSLE